MSDFTGKGNFPNGKIQYKTVNVAHRGASAHAPENTIASFDKALYLNADYFELDVQMTKDGELIIMHDTEVDRTTNGKGEIKDLTFDEIRQLDAGSWYDEFCAGEKVPSFEEVLNRYCDSDIGILIELKDPELYPGIEQKVAAMLAKYNMDKPNNDKWIVQSFDWESLQKFHRILPPMSKGALEGSGKAEDGKITDKQLKCIANFAKYINPDKDLLDEDTVDRIHQFGLKTWPYTIEDRESVDDLIEIEVDGIITNNPELLIPDAGEMKMALREFAREKEFTNELAVYELELDLTAAHYYEMNEVADEVIKHLKGFKQLLDQKKDNKRVNERAYNNLKRNANALIQKWVF